MSTNPTPQAEQTDGHSAPATPDDTLRRNAAKRLSRYLTRSDRLLARCEALSEGPTEDDLGPLSVAARLLNANARVAHALAHMALVERRQRTIFERIQPPKGPDPAELNSRKKTPEQARRDIGEKFARMQAQNRLEQLEHPIDPQEEANLRLQEEDWQEYLRNGGDFRSYYS